MPSMKYWNGQSWTKMDAGNADTVANKSVGNEANRIPINNKAKNVDLNADMVDGYHADINASADTIPVRDKDGVINASITGSAAKLGNYSAGNENGKIPVNNGQLNKNLNADMINGIYEYEIGVLSIFKSGKDSNGIYTTVEYKRADGTLYLKSLLIGTSPLYSKRTEMYYDKNGVSLLATKNYAIMYDNDGNIVSEVLE